MDFRLLMQLACLLLIPPLLDNIAIVENKA